MFNSRRENVNLSLLIDSFMFEQEKIFKNLKVNLIIKYDIHREIVERIYLAEICYNSRNSNPRNGFILH